MNRALELEINFFDTVLECFECTKKKTQGVCFSFP